MLKRAREDCSEAEAAALPELYSYWRSSASWRVRIACEYKKIPYLYHAVNLLKGEDSTPEYLAINPMGQIPAWVEPAAARGGCRTETNGETAANPAPLALTQSTAIIEYLEEKYPQAPKMLPGSLEDRAVVRALSLLIVSGIHPIQNLSVLQKVEKLAGGGQATKTKWAAEVIAEGLEAFDAAIAGTKGTFCFGNTFTLVDACLIPQLYNAERFGIDYKTLYKNIAAVLPNYEKLDFLHAAHPDQMPDAVKA